MNGKADVFLLKTSNRKDGVKSLLKQFDLSSYREKTVTLKGNFNSMDPFPASTHLHTLEAIVEVLKGAGVRDLILAERSGMGKTKDVLEQLGILDLSEKWDFKVVALEEDKAEWIKIEADGIHWLNGFHLSSLCKDTDGVIQTCCLKTHRYGGHFTMSLKNSIGLVARNAPRESYDYMRELHASPYQRYMIAEVNRFYNVDLVIMDAVKAFVTGGPEKGEVVEPRLLLASRDRVAIDAVGTAILRHYGSTKQIMKDDIFKLDQIQRATELDIGVKSSSDIRLISLTTESRDIEKKIEYILR